MVNIRSTLAAAALACLAAVPAHADTLDINMAGWFAGGDYGEDVNSSVFANIGVGATLTGFQYINLSFTTDPDGDSWQSELVLSVNDQLDAAEWLDWSPSTTDAPGTFGPASGFHGGPDGVDGPFGSSGPFVALDGTVFVTTYLSYIDPPVGITINSGTLRLEFTPAVPEPGTYGLAALGALAVVAAARRRRAR